MGEGGDNGLIVFYRLLLACSCCGYLTAHTVKSPCEFAKIVFTFIVKGYVKVACCKLRGVFFKLGKGAQNGKIGIGSIHKDKACGDKADPCYAVIRACFNIQVAKLGVKLIKPLQSSLSVAAAYERFYFVDGDKIVTTV